MNRSQLLRAALLCAFATPLSADVTVRVSLTDADNQPADASGTAPSHGVAISGDANRVAFTSLSSDHVPGDTNGEGDIFVRDRLAGTTVRASVSTVGVQANDICYLPCMSSDGRYVGWTTYATTLVPGDTNNRADVFLHDLSTAVTRRVSVSSTGVAGNDNSGSLSISDDGHWVVFFSNSTNLVSGDTNGVGDVFEHDTQTGTTRRISLSVTGGQANGFSVDPFISADSQTVAFVSGATNLGTTDTNGFADIYLYSRATGPAGRVDRGSGNPEPNGDSSWPSLSADGRFVAFTTEATNLIFGDTNGLDDIYVYDRVIESFTRVSVATGGGEANGESSKAEISENGRYICFESEASNLVPDDTNGFVDSFVHDRVTGETKLLNRSTEGVPGDGRSYHCAPSADGRTVAFGSQSNNLVPNDTNFVSDVYVREPEPLPETYCYGTARACPCGNPGQQNAGGCANSAYITGARLSSNADTNALTDGLVLNSTRLVPNQPALAFVGLDPIANGAGAAFGDGLRCAGTNAIRLGTETPNGQGFASFGPGLQAAGGWLPGDRRYFQVWYRDPQGPCGSGFNLTNGLRVDFGS